MIIDLPSTTSSAINRSLVDLREQGGTVALGRVLTLVVVTDESSAEEPIEAANGASFEHPCRVIVVARGSRRGAPRLDGQIRVGGDAGASEVIVLRLFGELADHAASVVMPLLLADSPVVAWWPADSPEVPADDPIGTLAQRRITDAAAARRPSAELAKRAGGYRPGDTDLAWTRLTMWRGLLAAALDQPPHEKITGATVSAASDSVSGDLLAGWLAQRLRCPVRRTVTAAAGSGVHSVVLTRKSGTIALDRPGAKTATLTVSRQPERSVALPRRTLRDCLAEEMRRLDADDVYAEALTKGLGLVDRSGRGRPTPTKPKPAPTKSKPAPTTSKPASATSTTVPASPAKPKAPARRTPAKKKG